MENKRAASLVFAIERTVDKVKAQNRTCDIYLSQRAIDLIWQKAAADNNFDIPDVKPVLESVMGLDAAPISGDSKYLVIVGERNSRWAIVIEETQTGVRASLAKDGEF